MVVQYPGVTSRTSVYALPSVGKRYTFEIEGVYDNPVLKGPVFMHEIFPPNALSGELMLAPGTTSFNVSGSEYTYYRVVNKQWYYASVDISTDVDNTGKLVFVAEGRTEYPEYFPDATFTSGSITLTEVCYADCDLNNVLNVFDFICYGERFAQMDTYADCNFSGSFDVFDYLCFFEAYSGNCQ